MSELFTERAYRPGQRVSAEAEPGGGSTAGNTLHDFHFILQGGVEVQFPAPAVRPPAADLEQQLEAELEAELVAEAEAERRGLQAGDWFGSLGGPSSPLSKRHWRRPSVVTATSPLILLAAGRDCFERFAALAGAATTRAIRVDLAQQTRGVLLRALPFAAFAEVDVRGGGGRDADSGSGSHRRAAHIRLRSLGAALQYFAVPAGTVLARSSAPPSSSPPPPPPPGRPHPLSIQLSQMSPLFGVVASGALRVAVGAVGAVGKGAGGAGSAGSAGNAGVTSLFSLRQGDVFTDSMVFGHRHSGNGLWAAKAFAGAASGATAAAEAAAAESGLEITLCAAVDSVLLVMPEAQFEAWLKVRRRAPSRERDSAHTALALRSHFDRA